MYATTLCLEATTNNNNNNNKSDNNSQKQQQERQQQKENTDCDNSGSSWSQRSGSALQSTHHDMLRGNVIHTNTRYITQGSHDTYSNTYTHLHTHTHTHAERLI